MSKESKKKKKLKGRQYLDYPEGHQQQKKENHWRSEMRV